MRMAVGVMITAVCVIIVSHYTGISRSSTGVLLLLLQLLLLLLQTYIAATVATGASHSGNNCSGNSGVEVPAVFPRDLPSSALQSEETDEMNKFAAKLSERKYFKSLIIQTICKN